LSTIGGKDSEGKEKGKPDHDLGGDKSKRGRKVTPEKRGRETYSKQRRERIRKRGKRKGGDLPLLMGG